MCSTLKEFYPWLSVVCLVGSKAVALAVLTLNKADRVFSDLSKQPVLPHDYHVQPDMRVEGKTGARIMEWFGLEKTCEEHLAQLPCSEQPQL